MERWAACSCCWLWTDVETWTSSPRPWSPRSFKQWCVVLCLSYTVISTVSFYQAAASHQLHSGLMRSGGSRSPGGGHNSITRHTSRQAVWQLFSTQAGRCACTSICVRLHCIILAYVLNFSHTLPSTQFDLCNAINAASMWCHISHIIFHVYDFLAFSSVDNFKIVCQSYYQNYQI